MDALLRNIFKNNNGCMGNKPFAISFSLKFSVRYSNLKRLRFNKVRKIKILFEAIYFVLDPL